MDKLRAELEMRLDCPHTEPFKVLTGTTLYADIFPELTTFTDLRPPELWGVPVFLEVALPENEYKILARPRL